MTKVAAEKSSKLTSFISLLSGIVVGAAAYGGYIYMQSKAQAPVTPGDTPADADLQASQNEDSGLTAQTTKSFKNILDSFKEKMSSYKSPFARPQYHSDVQVEEITTDELAPQAYVEDACTIPVLTNQDGNVVVFPSTFGFDIKNTDAGTTLLVIADPQDASAFHDQSDLIFVDQGSEYTFTDVYTFGPQDCYDTVEFSDNAIQALSTSVIPGLSVSTSEKRETKGSLINCLNPFFGKTTGETMNALDNFAITFDPVKETANVYADAYDLSPLHDSNNLKVGDSAFDEFYTLAPVQCFAKTFYSTKALEKLKLLIQNLVLP